MTLRLRFEDAFTGVLIADTFSSDAKIRMALNESGSWSAIIAANQRAVQDIDRGNVVKIYWNGNLYMTGTVKEFSKKFDEQTSISLRGQDILDDLYRRRANSEGQWRKRLNILSIFNELLATTPNWTLGEVGTFFNTQALRKMDLRDTERLFEQLKKGIENFSDTYFRYGGYEDGYHQLDVGAFGRKSGISILTAADPELVSADDMVGEIVNLDETTKLTDIFIACEASGGVYTNNSGKERTVYMGEAFDSDPTIIHDANYPLRETSGPHRWTVYNKALSDGPGGIVAAHNGRTTFNGAAGNAQVGETSSTSTDYTGVLVTFVPVPGILREILIWSFDGDTAAWPMANGANIRASLFEVTESTPGAHDWTATAADPIAEVDFLPNITGTYSPGGFSETSITFDQEIILEWDKTYAILFQPNTGTTGDQNYWSIAYDTGSTVPERTFTLTEVDVNNSVPNTDMTNYGNFISDRGTPMMAVITDPIENIIYEEITKQFSQYAPETDDDDPVTTAEIEDASISLYERVAAFLTDHSATKKTYQISAIGENILPTPGESIFVRGQAEGAYIDPFTGTAETYRTKIEADLIVDSLDINFGDDKLDVTFQVRDNPGTEAEDLLTSIYDKTKNNNKGKKMRVADPWYARRAVEVLSLSVATTPPTETMADGRKAVSVTLTPSTPAHVGQFFTLGKPYVINTPSAEMDIEWVTRPVAKIKKNVATAAEAGMEFTVPYVIKMAPRYRDWDYTDSADLEAIAIWR